MTLKDRRWLTVARADALGEGERLAVRVEGRPVLLLQREGRVYALENDCPHLGCPLTRGAFEGYLLTCPCHDWTFDIRTGAFEIAPEIKLKTYACRIEDGQIYLQLGGESDDHD